MEEEKKTKPHDDLAELLHRIALHKDRKAFQDLFETMAPKLKAFVMKAGVTESLAEEVVQESMLAVWRKAGTFDAKKASAATWLFTIVRNKRIDIQRKSSNREISSEDLYPGEQEADESAPPDEQVSEKKQADILKSMLKNLPPEQLQVVYKVYYEDKTHATVAEEMGLALGTVKSRIRLALAKLGIMAEDSL